MCMSTAHEKKKTGDSIGFVEYTQVHGPYWLLSII